jgi:hypothetical protein
VDSQPCCLFHRLADLAHGVILQEPQYPDELPLGLSLSGFFGTKTPVQRVEALRQVKIRQGEGVIQSARLALQKRKIVAVIEENALLAPAPRMLGYYLVAMA